MYCVTKNRLRTAVIFCTAESLGLQGNLVAYRSCFTASLCVNGHICVVFQSTPNVLRKESEILAKLDF